MVQASITKCTKLSIDMKARLFLIFDNGSGIPRFVNRTRLAKLPLAFGPYTKEVVKLQPPFRRPAAMLRSPLSALKFDLAYSLIGLGAVLCEKGPFCSVKSPFTLIELRKIKRLTPANVGVLNSRCLQPSTDHN